MVNTIFVMKQFLITESRYPQYDHCAAFELLQAHRIDCCANGRWFTMPLRAIQKTAGIAGAKVREVLRKEANPITVHPQDLTSPWLDVLAIHTLDFGGKSTVVLAFGASSKSIVKLLTGRQNLKPYAEPPLNTEKSLTLRRVSELVERYVNSANAGILGRNASVDRVLVNLQTTMPAGNDSSALFLVCSKSDHEAVTHAFSEAAIPVMQAETLAGFLTGILPSWREIIGSGWLPRINCFLRSLHLAMIRKDHSCSVQADVFGVACGPTEIAVGAAAKFTAFGWLPQQWVIDEKMRKQTPAGRFVKTVGGAMTDGDISLFTLPRIAFPGEEELKLGTPEERFESSWMQFQTSFAHDEIYFYCDHSAHGERAEDGSGYHEGGAPPRSLMPLGFLHPSALWVLRNLLPSLRIDIIAFSPASSTTTRSAVLERKLQLAKNKPGDADAIEILRAEAEALRFPERVVRPKESIHSYCMELDGCIASAPPSGGSDVAAFPSSWPLTLLERLFDAGRSRQGSAAYVLDTCIQLASLLLRVDPGKFRSLILEKEMGSVHELRLVQALYKMIKLGASKDRDVERTKGSRYGILKIRKELGLMLREAVTGGRLAVPPLLAEWMTNRVRITCVIAVDQFEHPPEPRPVQEGRRPLPGDFHAYRVYPQLFSADPVSSSIVVDVEPLLRHAVHALAPGDTVRNCGWLANKISQTNELVAAMIVRTGYLEDFPFGDLLSSKEKRNIHTMLAILPSKVLLRCILMEDEGRKCLEQWCDSLREEVTSHWQKETQDPGGKGGGLTSEARSLLAVFQDHAGMAAAALDCCRNRTPAQTGQRALCVHFLPDQLANFFRRPKLDRSLGAHAYTDR